MKFGKIVLQINKNRLAESDFQFESHLHMPAAGLEKNIGFLKKFLGF